MRLSSQGLGEMKGLIERQELELIHLRARVQVLEEALRGVMYRGEYSKHCACPDCATARAALTKTGDGQ